MKIDKDYKDSFVKSLETDLTIKAACLKNNLSRQTVYRWMKDDKVFAKEVAEAIKTCVLEVNDDCEAYMIKKIKAEDMNAIKFWLKFHHDDYKQAYIVSR